MKTSDTRELPNTTEIKKIGKNKKSNFVEILVLSHKFTLRLL